MAGTLTTMVLMSVSIAGADVETRGVGYARAVEHSAPLLADSGPPGQGEAPGTRKNRSDAPAPMPAPGLRFQKRRRRGKSLRTVVELAAENSPKVFKLRTQSKSRWARIIKDRPTWRSLGSPEEEIDLGVKIYSLASKTSLRSAVLGKVSLLKDADLLENFGILAQNTLLDKRLRFPTLKKLMTTDPGSDRLHVGSVLSEKLWWPYTNDTFLLGGVNTYTPFYMGQEVMQGPDVNMSLLWDVKKKRPTVLGRELIGLGEFGYEILDHEQLGKVVVPVDLAKAYDADISDYLDILDAFKKEQEFSGYITDLLKKKKPLSWHEYELPPRPDKV